MVEPENMAFAVLRDRRTKNRDAIAKLERTMGGSQDQVGRLEARVTALATRT